MWKKVFNISLTIFLLFVCISTVNAQTIINSQAKVTVVFRNPDGNYIPNVNFEIFVQTQDVDGYPKPGKKIGGGKTDSILGRGEVKFTPSESNFYVIKAYEKNSGVGAFWFYNSFSINAGEEQTVSLTLSGIKIIFRDSENNLKTNIPFSIYTQRYNVDEKAIKGKQDLIGSYTMPDTGSITVYVPSPNRRIIDDGRNGFVLEATNDKDAFTKYDISVSDGNITEIEYKFSDMKLYVVDSKDVSFPAKTKLSIYKQELNENNEKELSTFIRDILTNDKGEAIFTYPAGTYAAKINSTNSQALTFYDLVIVDQERKVYTIKTSSDWQPSEGACTKTSNITVTIKGYNDKYIPGLKYEIVEQITGANSKPTTGKSIKIGTFDTSGKAVVTFNPDTRKVYALKITDPKLKNADFWYYSELRFTCGENATISKILPAFNVTLRNGKNELKKNYKFSIYKQSYDVDGRPIIDAKNLVSAGLSTGETGRAILYLPPDNPNDSDGRNIFIFSANGEISNTQYNEYNIKVASDKDYDFDYVFSDIVLTIKNANGQSYGGKSIEMYQQITDTNNQKSLGKKLVSGKTDINGVKKFELPSGYYALVIKDDLEQNNIFWETYVQNEKRTNKEIKTNITRLQVNNSTDQLKSKVAINVYLLKQNDKGNYYKDKKIKSLTTSASGILEVSLSQSPYLFTVVQNKKEYGRALYAENGKIQSVNIVLSSEGEIANGQEFKLVKPSSISTSAQGKAEKLKGYILLQVESHGEAWYVDSVTKKRYYMSDGKAAYEIMRKFGLGIKTNELKKIPIGLDSRFEEYDYDGDYVPDKMEEALGTDMYIYDSDRDNYDDGYEVLHNYNPAGIGKLPIDLNFTNRLKGKVLLQIENKGQAWYVNPRDGKRYYMKDGDSAYQIMRYLSLGIKNSDLEEIEEGRLN